LCGSVGIQSLAIARNQFDAGMLSQPEGKRLRTAIWQQIRDQMAIEIHQNRSVGMVLAPGPIIDSKVTDGILTGRCEPEQSAPNGIVTRLNR
jgi:hypothetical protein